MEDDDENLPFLSQFFYRTEYFFDVYCMLLFSAERTLLHVGPHVYMYKPA